MKEISLLIVSIKNTPKEEIFAFLKYDDARDCALDIVKKINQQIIDSDLKTKDKEIEYFKEAGEDMWGNPVDSIRIKTIPVITEKEKFKIF